MIFYGCPPWKKTKGQNKTKQKMKNKLNKLAVFAAIGAATSANTFAAFDYADLVTATNGEYTAGVAALVGVAVGYLGIKAAGAGISLLGGWVSKLRGGK